MNANHYDLIVIGAGPAGESAAITAAILGKRVAVLEKAAHPGGAAVNTGTVPSKTLRETALALSGFKSRELYGVDLSLRRDVTIDELLRHERAVRNGEQARIRKAFEQHGITLVQARGEFHDANTILAHAFDGSTQTLTASKIIIAIGSTPFRPAEIPFEHNCIHDSDELLNLHEMPRSIAVVGAGVIGSEYACMFAALGVPTFLIDGRDRLMPFLDRELSQSLEGAMSKLGVQFIWNQKVVSCPDPGREKIKLTLSSGTRLDVDHVLFCAGRMSRTAELHPERAGVTLGDKGRLTVNEFFQTNVPHIYAVGDVIGHPALASTSAEQGRAAASHLFEMSGVSSCLSVLPAGIYTIPEVSSVGATEEELKQKNIHYVVGRASYSDIPRGKIIGDREGFLKLLFDRDSRQLLGAHVMGESATEVIHIAVMALMTQAKYDLFLRTCFNYPTLGELYKYATLDAWQTAWNS